VAPDHLSFFHGPKGAPLWLLAYYLMIALKYNANWAFIQRLYCVRDERAARRVAWISGILFLTTPVLFVVPPLAARVVLPGLENGEEAYSAIAAELLPSGLLGMMLAAMFSATMSSLNSEYNVMAGVITNDIYKRLVFPRAGASHLLWAGRVFTVFIGLGITIGAMLVGGMGGAFEANKLFTSILAIPLAVPLLFGLLLRRPTSLSLVCTVSLGALLALVLNFWEPLWSWLAGGEEVGRGAVWQTWGTCSWEAATLVTIVVCGILFAVTGRVFHMSKTKQSAVDQFLQKLRTPLAAEKIPTVSPLVRNRLALLFGGSFTIVGLIYIGVSLASIMEFSGLVGMAAGLLCAVCGGATCLWTANCILKEGGS
jgi:Na+/proline symporter